MTIRERIESKIERMPPAPGWASGCWVWTGSLTRDGYGHVSISGDKKLAHRVAYEEIVGPYPRGLETDHLCRVRSCVNPDHLEPVTLDENHRRGDRATRAQCEAGHVYTERTLYVWTNPQGRKRRRCRTCGTAAARRYQSRRLSAAKR